MSDKEQPPMRRMRVEQDLQCEFPDDMLRGNMVGYHRSFQLPSPYYTQDAEWRETIKEFPDAIPIYMHEHGGRVLSTKPFSCPYDSGTLGFVHGTTLEDLKGDLEILSAYLNGEVYGYVVEERDECPCCGHTEWEEVHSCWGYYGDPEKSGLLEDAKEHVDAEG